jgi:hypothetical protein
MVILLSCVGCDPDQIATMVMVIGTDGVFRSLCYTFDILTIDH